MEKALIESTVYAKALIKMYVAKCEMQGEKITIPEALERMVKEYCTPKGIEI